MKKQELLDLFLTNTAKSIDANFQHQQIEDNKIDERVNLGVGKTDHVTTGDAFELNCHGTMM